TPWWVTRTRCWPPSSGIGSVKLPLASVLVRPASCMPCESFRMTTSSPAEGLLDVLLVTLPVRSAAMVVAVSASTTIVQRRAGAAKMVFSNGLLIIRFKSVSDWKQSIAPVALQAAYPVKLRSRPGSRRLRLRANCAATRSPAPGTSLLYSRSLGREDFRKPLACVLRDERGVACRWRVRTQLRERRRRGAVQRRTGCRRQQSQLRLPSSLFPIWVECCRGNRHGWSWLSLLPLADHNGRPKRRREEHGKRHDPGHSIEAACAGRGEDRRPVLAHERLQNGIVVGVVLHGGRKFLSHLVGVSAAYVIALKQHLIAAANANNAVMTEFVEARRIATRSKQCQGEGNDDSRRANFAETNHQSPVSTGSVCAGSGTMIARTRCAWGTAAAVIGGTMATMVPKIRIQTPAQIHITRGLMNALIIGRSVSKFLPA